MVGFMPDATVTVKLIVDVPRGSAPSYVVSVAVAVPDVLPLMAASQVLGMVNVAEVSPAPLFTVTVGAVPQVSSSLYVKFGPKFVHVAVPELPTSTGLVTLLSVDPATCHTAYRVMSASVV